MGFKPLKITKEDSLNIDKFSPKEVLEAFKIDN